VTGPVLADRDSFMLCCFPQLRRSLSKVHKLNFWKHSKSKNQCKEETIQPRNEEQAISQRSILIAIFLVAAFACLAGCGSGSSNVSNTTASIAVADYGNSRALLYSAPLSDNQSASVVLGQADFTTATAALTATGMNAPADIAEDSAGNLYVSDYMNYRVLQFKPPFTNGMAASVAIGQPDFVTGTPNTTQNGLGGPVAPFIGGPALLAFDSSGNLWVVDFGNSRVLEYQPPFATDMNASLVIGQANFTSGTSATTNSGLAGPGGIAFDSAGDLWVADEYNSRVLQFKPPFATGMSASIVIGQANFTSNGPAATPSALNFPIGIAFDSSGDLWVGDIRNNRVLQYKPPFATGMSASLVLGQTDFTSSSAAITQSGLDQPAGISFDSKGDLLVADNLNNRTLVFEPPFSTGQNASLVLGQPNFTTNTAATTATGQSGPSSVRPLF
jgi:sugar lactone lactonase YvrE